MRNVSKMMLMGFMGVPTQEEWKMTKAVSERNLIAVVVVGLCMTFLGPTSLFGQVYDANADFDASLEPPGPGGTNPNGVWTYSWSVGLFGSLTPFSFLDDPAPVNCNAEAIWIDPAIDVGWTPSVAKSVHGPCVDGNVTFGRDELILHGGGTGETGGNGYAHVIFTAPEDATCSVDATFIGRQNFIDVDVHVLLRGISVFDDMITADGVSTSYSNASVSFSAGDTISFAVGPNGNFALHPGNTALEAIIDCVSEPIPIRVDIDIKPQSCPNPLDVKSKGVLPVAILGTADFDVTQVNQGSITLVGIPPSRAIFNDTATPFEPFIGKEPTYFNDFDGGLLLAPGVTASLGGIITTESVQGYAGFGTGGNIFGGDFLRNTTGGLPDIGVPGSPTTLTLTGLPPHTSIDINFLLGIIDSWDGSLPGPPPPDGCDFCHPDIFTVTVDGTTVFSESFGFNGPTFIPAPGVLLSMFTNLGFDLGLSPIPIYTGLDVIEGTTIRSATPARLWAKTCSVKKS